MTMKRLLVFASSAILALAILASGCDDEDKCDKCVDDYCDCIKSAGEDLAKALECTTDVSSCLADNDCDEGDINENSCD
jgi:hypothetical protein